MIKKTENGYEAPSSKDPNKKYVVSDNLLSCDCPAFKYWLKGQGECKHIKAVKEWLNTVSSVEEIKFDKKSYITPLPDYEFEEQYGEEVLEHLLQTKQAFMMGGKVRLL